jgi:hydrogenase/urease accessory protein HupE
MNERSKPRAFAVATIVCLVLLALLAVVQVAHAHPNDSDADHCPLCIVMHTAAPITVAAAVIIMVQIGTPAPVLETRAIVRHWHPTLFTRPPPVTR